MRGVKEKPLNFKMKNKKIIELEGKINAEIVSKREEWKVEILREMKKRKFRELSTERKLRKKKKLKN